MPAVKENLRDRDPSDILARMTVREKGNGRAGVLGIEIEIGIETGTEIGNEKEDQRVLLFEGSMDGSIPRSGRLVRDMSIMGTRNGNTFEKLKGLQEVIYDLRMGMKA